MPSMAINNVVQGLANRTTTGVNNLEIARQLELAKFNLINALVELPATAIWILNKYQSNIVDDEQAIETTKRGDSLKTLKKQCLIVGQSLGENDWFSEENDEKRQFIEAFCAFPFSFDDLIELTDLMVYAFQARGLCYRAADFSQAKRADWMIKRLKQLKSTVSKQLKVLPSADFLSDEALYQCVINSIVAEHLWLSLRQKLVETNTKLVAFIANQYKAGFLDFDDLIQEGQTGLLIAVDKFDSRFGCQFSTYAAYWIRQRILRAHSRNERVVRVPCEQVTQINKLFRFKNEWVAKTGKEPSVEELADYSKLSIDEVNAILSISQTALSLENFDSDDEVLAPIDVIEQQVFPHAFKEIAQTELKNWLELAIKTLSSRESAVVCSHFGLHNNDSEMTLQEIGTQLNISRERVRQIQVMAFNKMKLSYGEQLVSFL